MNARKWTAEALAYNSLVIASPELTKLPMAERERTSEAEGNVLKENSP